MNENANPNGDVSPKLPAFSAPEAHAKTPEEWRSYCVELLAEIERLQADIGVLREQNQGLAPAPPGPEKVQLLIGKSFEDFMAMCEGQPTLEDILLDFEQKHGR